MKIDYQLIKSYIESHPEKALVHFEELTADEIVEALEGLPITTITQVVSRLLSFKGARVLAKLPNQTFIKVFRNMDPVKATSLFSREKSKEKYLLLSDSEKKDIDELSKYPIDSAGYLMDMSVKTVRSSETVENIIRDLKKTKDATRDLFVVNLEGHLVGYVPVQEIIFSEKNLIVENIMYKNPPSVNSLSPRQDVIETFETFKTTVLPVVHVDGSLLGAIRYTSLVRAAQNQAISAMASLGGASPEERVFSVPVFSVKKRLPWLIINLLTAFIASAVVGIFEGTIAKITALAVLLPVVAGQSGNTGAQAMAVTMRGLALREVRARQWIKVLFKELRVGFVNGVAIAILTGVSVYFWSNNFPLGIVITVAMVFSMVVASMAGAGIPIILSAMGKDPAQSSSVILTTVTDVMGFLSFLGLATIFSAMLLGN